MKKFVIKLFLGVSTTQEAYLKGPISVVAASTRYGKTLLKMKLFELEVNICVVFFIKSNIPPLGAKKKKDFYFWLNCQICAGDMTVL